MHQQHTPLDVTSGGSDRSYSRQISMTELEAARLHILDKLTGPHTKARSQAPAHYPPRNVEPDQLSFDDPSYKPTYYASPKIYGDPATLPAWATRLPADDSAREEYLKSLTKNPGGPTGIYGPGELGQPVNWAADPVALTINPETGDIYQVQIMRDIGEWAIPGGMVDSGETHISAALREFFEETGTKLSGIESTELYQGYVDDYRNTDTHYIKSSVFMFVIPWDQAQKMKFATVDQSEGIKERRWRQLNTENVSSLFASHPEFVKLGLIQLAKEVGQHVSQNLQERVLSNISSIVLT